MYRGCRRATAFPFLLRIRYLISMTCFIAGATGYTGQAVIDQLRKQQLDCIAHIRPESSSLKTKKQQFEELGAVVDTSLWNVDSMQQAMQRYQPTHIFALLGTTQQKNKKEQQAGRQASYDQIDRDLTLMLYDAASTISSPPTFVYLSSWGADKPTGAYLKARYDVEQILIHGPLPYLIARPGFISGKDREEFRPMERFGALTSDAILRGLRLIGWRSGYQRYASLTADQLASGLIHFAFGESVHNVVYSHDLRQR